MQSVTWTAQTHVCAPCRLCLLARLYNRHKPAQSPASRRSISAASAQTALRQVKRSPVHRGLRPDANTVDAGLRISSSSSSSSSSRRVLSTAPAKRAAEAGEEALLDRRRRLHGETGACLDGPPRTVEAVVRAARQRYGDRLPQGVLRGEEEHRVYERLYGAPLPALGEGEGSVLLAETEVSGGNSVLLAETEGGELREVVEEEEDVALSRGKRSRRLREETETSIDRASESEEDSEFPSEEQQQDYNEEADEADESLRVHPLTLGGRFSTFPSTTQLPKDTFVNPVAAMLADTANVHLDQAAERIFAGPGLPNANATPTISKTMSQNPIPLSASQTHMSEMEAKIYMATLMPGNYAIATSILAEVRRRLGSAWIERMVQPGSEPRVLDAGGGGAAVLAWRDVLRAEWDRMQETDKSQKRKLSLGKATVLTGSDALRHGVSKLLDNTTFLPRLPDYVHTIFGEDSPRKQFDLVIAPHSLWHISEDYLRRQQLQNLWSLVNPDGGVLILWEKGIPRGFEVIADARHHILTDLCTPPNASAPDEPPTRPVGRIIAPCTNHAKCPMYTVPGISQGRKDYCYFEQRFIRPPFYQRLIGARDRNHEDVPYSYIAVQKGRHAAPRQQPQHLSFTPPKTGDEATEAAFAGHDASWADESPSSPQSAQPPTPTDAQIYAHLPRILLPPLKRRGHVVLDLCTPAATLERWTVPKSRGRHIYRDARKAQWGDLWALGAKSRVQRRVRIGVVGRQGDGEGKGIVERGKKKGRAKARKRRREETRALLLKGHEREE